jgi:hypothetical protein
MVTLWLLVGCMAGPNEDTVVDDVRVLAIQADPPEVGPGEASALTVTVVDPAGLAPDVLLWTCLDLGEGCLEAAGPADSWLTLATPADEQILSPRFAPPALASVLGDELPTLPVPTWALACPPGVCPLIEDAREALGAGAVPEDLAARLAAPEAELASLGFEEVSLARASLWVTSLPESERNRAPVLQGVEIDGDQLIVTAEDPDGDDLQAWPYATAGAFERPQVPLGSDPLVYYPPDDGGSARLYVVVDDSRGGQALWRGSFGP